MIQTARVDRHTGPAPRLAAVAAVAYVVATTLGVAMRFEFVGWSSGIPFDHLLHAHSHTLYFGWAALGLLAVGVSGIDRLDGTLRWGTVGAVTVVPLLLLGFLLTGYHPVTIAVSAVAMFAWYAVAAGWWPRIDRRIPGSRLGLVYLVVASLGVWALGVVQAIDGSRLAADLAIHAFLLGFGWFLVFGAFGAVAGVAQERGWTLDGPTVQRTLRRLGATAWITFPLGVVGGPEVPVLGSLARLSGLVVLIAGARLVGLLWTAAAGSDRVMLRLSSLWLSMALGTIATVALVGSPALLAGGRQGVVIHLHALFLGFFTPLLALVLTPARAWLAGHHAGVAVMLTGLAAMALGTPFGAEVAAVGAGVTWLAGVGWAWPLVRRVPPRVPIGGRFRP